MSTIFQSTIDNNQWFIHLLFGRYRNVNNFTYLHLIIILIIGILAVYIYLLLLSLKFQRYRKLLPYTNNHANTHTTTIQLPITRALMNRKLYSAVMKYEMLYDTICQYKIQPEDNTQYQQRTNGSNNDNNHSSNNNNKILIGDSGWGFQYIPISTIHTSPLPYYRQHHQHHNNTHTHYDGIHTVTSPSNNIHHTVDFNGLHHTSRDRHGDIHDNDHVYKYTIHYNTCILQSIDLIEKHVIDRKPTLSYIHTNSQNIVEYMKILEHNFQIPPRLSHPYIEIYMNVLHDTVKYNESEYKDFMRLVYQMVCIISGGGSGSKPSRASPESSSYR